eukprot:15143686-Heterocapsa_arctica.AAC.1
MPAPGAEHRTKNKHDLTQAPLQTPQLTTFTHFKKVSLPWVPQPSLPPPTAALPAWGCWMPKPKKLTPLPFT